MRLKTILLDESGQDLAEYGLLFGFIALVVVAGVTQFGLDLSGFWDRLAAAVIFRS